VGVPAAVAGAPTTLDRTPGPRIEARRQGPEERELSHTVVAELVANVLKVTASAGDTVGPEDILVILESMKMEIPVLAEVAGTVVELKVVEGEVVRDGDPIAVIET
jgi:acetyl-CoA carboxylase biotin carboxyl carrier protein